MWLVASRVGVDLDEVSATVALSAEGSINPQYGIRGGAPYGGACLPKDTIGFLGFAADHGVAMPLLEAVVRVNERLHALQGCGPGDESAATDTQRKPAVLPEPRIRIQDAAMPAAGPRPGR
jgi:UDP-glucose/GDP-mannose dehydrogenase family, central domain